MKKVFSFFLLVILLSGCDNDMKLISRDFSVSLKNMDSNTATVGKVVKCVFTVDGLDKDNDDLLYTSFDIEGGTVLSLSKTTNTVREKRFPSIINRATVYLLILSRP